MRVADAVFIVFIGVLVAFYIFCAGAEYGQKHAQQPPVVQLCDESQPRKIIWQEMPKLAWQKSDGSQCDVGYVGECSLLEAGSVSVTMKDSGVDYDWSSMCACRVVREP